MQQYEQAVAAWQARAAGQADLPRDFEILFAYHSGRLEDRRITFSDTREIFCSGTVSDYTGPVSVLNEVVNLKRCCELLRCRLKEGRALNLALALELYERLTLGMEDGQLEQPLPDDKARLHEVLEEVCAYTGDLVLKAGTYLHAASACLAPFGRYSAQIARLLLNYYLLRRGHPPVLIYSFDGEIYRECLDRFVELEELTPLYKFLQYETEKFWVRADSLSGAPV